MSQSKNVSKIFGGIEIVNFIDSGHQKISNVATPENPTDGVNKLYVDTLVNNKIISAGIGLTEIDNVFNVNNNLPNVTGLGNINSGSWSSDTILINYGGTGQTSFAPHKLIVGNGTSPLDSYSHITVEDNLVTFDTSLLFSNTSNSQNATSGGAITILGGVSIAKNTIIGGDLLVNGNATIQNLNVPGNFNISTIQSQSSNFTNLTASNLTSSFNTCNNIYIVNVTGTSILCTNATFSNLYTNIGTINNLYITSNFYSNNTSLGNLIFNYATGKSFYISNLTASNTTILNSSINTSILSNCTAANIYISNCTNTNLYSQNGQFLNTTIVNFTNSNSILNNSTINNLQTFNLITSYSTISNIIVSNLSSSNTNISNLSANNLITTNATFANSYLNNSTISNLNVVNTSQLNNIISNTISTSNLYCNTVSSSLSNNANTISTYNTLSSIISTNISSGTLYTNTISSTYISSSYISSSSVISTYATHTNSTITNLSVNNLSNTISFNTTCNSTNLIASKSSLLNTSITSATILSSNITNATISSVVITNSLSLKKAFNVGSNYSSQPLTTSGALFTANMINFTDNISLSTNSRWFGSYFSTPTLSALNPNITTSQAATVYIQGKPLNGANQTITYSTNMALGYIPVPTSGNLTGQLMFERYDGNWFSSIYVDSSNKFIINNASNNANAGIGLYVCNSTPIDFSYIPNVSNVTPTKFITFSSNTTTFYSTIDSTSNITNASVVFNGGISILKTLNVNSNALIPNITSNSIISINISTSNLSSVNLSSTNLINNNATISTLNIQNGLTTGNINFTGILSQNGSPYISSQWTSSTDGSGALSYTGGNVYITNGIYITGCVSSSSLKTSNISTNTLNISQGLTTGNINFTGSLSQNGLPYISSQWTSTDDSSGSLFYTSGNIGIGNSSPNYTLDVTGDANFSNSINTSNATIGTLNAPNGLTTGNINFIGSLYQNGIPYIGSQWTSTTSGSLFYTSGNIGIGNTSPNYTLDVTGDVNVSGSINVSNFSPSNINTTNLTCNNLNLNNFTTGTLVVENINIGVSNTFSRSFLANNNVTSPSSITGLVFSSSSVLSFVADVNIHIVTNTNTINEHYKINSVFTSSTGWSLYTSSIGDISGISFSIDSTSGQLLYTSTNIQGFTSSIIRFTVTQTSVNGTYTSLLNPTSGNTYTMDSIQITNTTDAVPGTSTGALNVLGGVNVEKTIYSKNVNVSDTASIGNLTLNSGIVGPTLLLQNHFIDAFNVGTETNTGFTASNSIIFTEPGNPGIYYAIGNNSGFGTSVISNASNDTISWNYARLMIRGVSLNTNSISSSILIQPYILESKTGIMHTQESFIVTDSGSDYGYSTWISPWIPTNNINALQSIGIKILSITTGNTITSGSVRIGPTYLQFTS